MCALRNNRQVEIPRPRRLQVAVRITTGLAVLCGVQLAAVPPVAAINVGRLLRVRPQQHLEKFALGSKMAFLNVPQEAPLPLKVLVIGCGRSGTLYTAKALNLAGLRAGHEWIWPGTKNVKGTMGLGSQLFTSLLPELAHNGLMRELGVRPPQEKVSGVHLLGHNALVSWYATVQNPKIVPPIGLQRDQLNPAYVLHQVRHPLKVISSAHTLGDRAWAFICAHTSARMTDRPLVRAAKYWLEWNRMAHDPKNSKFTYRIEVIENIWGDVFASSVPGVHDARQVFGSEKAPAKTTNTRQALKEYRKIHSWAELGRGLSYDSLYEQIRELAWDYGYGDALEARPGNRIH